MPPEPSIAATASQRLGRDGTLVRFARNAFHLASGNASAVALGMVTLAYLTLVKLGGEPIGDRPLLIAGVLLVLVGVQLTLFGLLAELIVHARHQERRT